MNRPRQTTPASINENVRMLCKKIGIDAEPSYVQVRPVSDYPLDECFDNAACHAKTHGGSVQHGWMIWEGQLLIEAVFHCVWRNSAGELIDVTPLADGEQRILFLPDPMRVFDRLYDNVRIPVTWSLETIAMIFQGEELHKLRASVFPARTTTFDNEKQKALEQRILTRLREFGPYCECLCGSGKKFKFCHMMRPHR